MAGLVLASRWLVGDIAISERRLVEMYREALAALAPADPEAGEAPGQR